MIKSILNFLLLTSSVLLFLQSCKSESLKLNGTYEYNCGPMDDKFEIFNDSLVKFYESDGYDLDQDLKEAYDPNKPLSKKWKLNNDIGVKKIIYFKEKNIVVINKYEYAPLNDTFEIVTYDNSIISLDINHKKTLQDEMSNPNKLDCYWKKEYYKINK